MSDNKKLIGSVIFGLAAGAAIGILFAPEKGAQTRRKISYTTTNLFNHLIARLDEGKLVLNKFRGKAMEKFDTYKDMAMRNADNTFEDAETEVDYLKRKEKQSVYHS